MEVIRLAGLEFKIIGWEAKIIGWEGYLFVVEHKHEAKPLGVVKGEDLRVKMDCKSL